MRKMYYVQRLKCNKTSEDQQECRQGLYDREPHASRTDLPHGLPAKRVANHERDEPQGYGTDCITRLDKSGRKYLAQNCREQDSCQDVAQYVGRSEALQEPRQEQSQPKDHPESKYLVHDLESFPPLIALSENPVARPSTQLASTPDRLPTPTLLILPTTPFTNSMTSAMAHQS